MRHNQSLFDITRNILGGLENVLITEKPDLVMVQGDATSAFIGALAAFYMKIPVAHVEAGLRSFNKYARLFRKRSIRIFVSHMADYHFAPTLKAKDNLIHEGIKEDRVYVVGNTVIDALYLTLSMNKNDEEHFSNYFGLPGSRETHCPGNLPQAGEFRGTVQKYVPGIARYRHRR